MIQLKQINGLHIDYSSSIELTAKGNSTSISLLKAMLTIKNKSVEAQIAALKRAVPRNQRHAAAIYNQMQELQSKETYTPWSENEDGSISLPPGYWYLGEMSSDDHLNSTTPILLGDERYYQEEIVRELLKYKRSCTVAATGIGKGRIVRDLVLSYVSSGKRVLVCVPSIELLSQTAATIDSGLEAKGLAKCGRMGHGKKPKDGSMSVVSTIQSAINIVDMFDAVIFDEAHIVSAESYQKVAAGAVNAEFVHGLTATIERPDGLTPLIHAWCGPAVYQYPYKKAVEEGYLASVKYYSKKLHSAGRSFHGMHATKEYISLHSDDQFIRSVAGIVNNSLNAGRKTLVLFKASECCEKLAAVLGTTAANGNYRLPLDDFKTNKSSLLIGNTSLLSTGIDVPDISAIIFVAAGSSEIVFMQSMGRGTRMSPGKKDCVVVDITPDHPKYTRQAAARRAMALKAGYQVT